jgi:hypothetical protein
MIPLAAMAALAAGFVADGSARVETRAGSTDGGQNPSSVGVSADLQGRASGPDGALRFGLLPSAVRAQGSQLFVRGFAEAELRFRPGALLRLRQAGGFGSVDLSPVAPGAGPGPVQPPAGSRFVSVQESTTSLELDVAASRRLRMAGSAAWVVTGGANAEARASFPLSRGPLFRAHFDWTATRRDTLQLEVAGFDYRYSNGQRASVASLAAGFRTQLSRGTELSLSLGPGIGRTETQDRPAAALVYAVGAADLRSTLVRDLSASIGVVLEPLGDPLTGELIERGSLRASAVWDRHRVVTVAARLLGSVALTSGTGSPTSPQAGDRYLQGELSATVPLDARSSLAAGVRAAFLSRPLLDQPTGQWVAFASFVVQLPLLR